MSDIALTDIGVADDDVKGTYDFPPPRVLAEDKPAERPIWKHDHLRPTQRGWLFLGQHGGPCDKACAFCYYSYQKNLVFFDLPTLIGHANRMRHYYGLRYCDISGGEPTIFGPKDGDGRRPQLEALVAHCRAIGLAPTIISHGQNNTAALVAGLEAAGLEDWLLSLHGMPRGHNAAVVDHQGRGDGGWARLVAGLDHCERPVRFNTTLQAFNYRELPDLAQWLADNRPPTVWNLIQFNPFFAWAGREVIEFQERMSTLAPWVGRAVATAEAAGWEVNVRYFSPCVAAEWGFARNCVGFFQTQMDPWEWALVATERVPMAVINEHGGVHRTNLAMCRGIAERRANDVCRTCRFFGTVCEGPPEQYVSRFGLDELRPSPGEPVSDVAYFERGGSW